MRALLLLLPTRWWAGWLVALCVVVGGAACGGSTPRETRRLDRSVITRDQMLKGDYVTVYDAVAALRSNWMRPRGPDSFVLPSIVWVYIDGQRARSEEHTSELQSLTNLVCRLLLEKKKQNTLRSYGRNQHYLNLD